MTPYPSPYAQAQDAWTPMLWMFYPSAVVADLIINVSVLSAVNGGEMPSVGMNFLPQSQAGWIYRWA